MKLKYCEIYAIFIIPFYKCFQIIKLYDNMEYKCADFMHAEYDAA